MYRYGFPVEHLEELTAAEDAAEKLQDKLLTVQKAQADEKVNVYTHTHVHIHTGKYTHTNVHIHTGS